MQHNRAGRKLGRTSAHRKALFRNQLDSLFLHERIQTTISKAKELRPLAEKLVTLARRGGLHARRLALRDISQDAAKRLFDEIAPRFATRPGATPGSSSSASGRATRRRRRSSSSSTSTTRSGAPRRRPPRRP
jgi:LSU ribosomal protein L17P